MMDFVSHSRNFEDVLLWRALKQIKNGFYLDFNPEHPVFPNFSMSFYKLGWRGLNLVDKPQLVDLFSHERSRDMVFFTQDPNIKGLNFRAIYNSYINQEVHFLRIKLCGHNSSISLMWSDVQGFRPWVVVLNYEDILETISVTSSKNELLFLEKNYVCCFFDGINQYFLSKEKVELLGDYFKVPVNYLDNYQTYENLKCKQENKTLSDKLIYQAKEIELLYQESYENMRHSAVLSVGLYNEKMKNEQIKPVFDKKLPFFNAPKSENVFFLSFKKSIKTLVKPFARLIRRISRDLKSSLVD